MASQWGGLALPWCDRLVEHCGAWLRAAGVPLRGAFAPVAFPTFAQVLAVMCRAPWELVA